MPDDAPDFIATAVRHSATLSQLRPTDDQIERLRTDFTSILQWIDQINTAPVQNLAPLHHPLGLSVTAAPDQVTADPAGHEACQQLAPETREGFYIVPRFLH